MRDRAYQLQVTTTPYVLEDKQLFVELLNVLNHILRTQVTTRVLLWAPNLFDSGRGFTEICDALRPEPGNGRPQAN